MSEESFVKLAFAADRASRLPDRIPSDLTDLAEMVTASLDAASGVAAAIVASGSEPSQRPPMNRTVKVPKSHQPRRTSPPTGGLTITRPGGVAVENGLDGLAAALGETLSQIGTSGRALVASVNWRDSYPESRHLDDNGQANGRKLDEMRVASVGGVPGPAEPIYDVSVLGQNDRPLRDALPRFLAVRGEVIANRAPLLSSIVVDSGSGSAVTTVTSAQDASGTTKGVQPVDNPTAITATVRAVAQRLQLSNFSDRFASEWTVAWVKLTLAAAARRAEQLLLIDLQAESVHQTDTPAKYGAFRDAKRAISAMVSELRDRERDYTTAIKLAVPSYMVDMLVSDLVAQQAGDESWSVTRDDVINDIRTWGGGVEPVVVYEGVNGRTLTTPSGQSPRTAAFDADVDVFAWWSNSLLYLDGGQLDLGIIRDTVVSASNRFQTFYESWEALLRVGAQPVRATLSLCADGAAQAASNIAVCSPENS